MPLDASIISNGVQAPKFDNPMDVAAKAMTMQQLANQNQASSQALADDQAVRGAYKNAMTVDDNGNPKLDQKLLMSNLAQNAPKQFVETSKALTQQSLLDQKAKLDQLTSDQEAKKTLMFQVPVGTPGAPDAYKDMVTKARQLGLSGSDKLPDEYPGDQAFTSIAHSVLSHSDQVAEQKNQFDQQFKQKEFTQNQARLDLEQSKHVSDKQGQARQQTVQLLESARGNPAAAQAEKDLYAAQKLKSLLNVHADPNDMNPAEVQLAATEVAKIASGGIPTSHELQGLVPSTIPSGLASLAQSVMNNPHGAQAGEFMKAYGNYADSLSNDAKQVITDKYGRIITSNSRAMSKDDVKTLQDQYMNRFNDDSKPKSKQQQQKTGAAAHPDAPAALQWANDPANAGPKADEIRARLSGGQ